MMSNKVNKTSIATGFVAFGTGAALLALKSQVDSMKKEIETTNTRLKDLPTWDVFETIERLVKSQGRRIDYLEGLLERNGIDVAPQRKVHWDEERHFKRADNSVRGAVRREENDEYSYEENERPTETRRMQHKTPNVVKEATNHIKTPTSMPLNHPSTVPRQHPIVRGELIEKSEQELDTEVLDDIY